MRQIYLKSVPSWNKLSEKELLAIAKIFRQPKYEKSLPTKAFLAVNGLRVKPGHVLTRTSDGYIFKSYIFQKNWKRKFTIGANIFASMVKKMEWIEDPITMFQPLRRIAGYKSSDFRLYDTSLEQFLFADKMYNAFISTGKIGYLRQLAAAYYRPQKRAFNTSSNKRRSIKFVFASKDQLYVTFLWFTAVKRWINGKYPFVFKSDESSSMPADESLLCLLSSLNQGDVTRNPKIFKTHVHEALYQINLMAENASKNVRSI